MSFDPKRRSYDRDTPSGKRPRGDEGGSPRNPSAITPLKHPSSMDGGSSGYRNGREDWSRSNHDSSSSRRYEERTPNSSSSSSHYSSDYRQRSGEDSGHGNSPRSYYDTHNNHNSSSNYRKQSADASESPRTNYNDRDFASRTPSGSFRSYEGSSRPYDSASPRESLGTYERSGSSNYEDRRNSNAYSENNSPRTSHQDSYHGGRYREEPQRSSNTWDKAPSRSGSGSSYTGYDDRRNSNNFDNRNYSDYGNESKYSRRESDDFSRRSISGENLSRNSSTETPSRTSSGGYASSYDNRGVNGLPGSRNNSDGGEKSRAYEDRYQRPAAESFSPRTFNDRSPRSYDSSNSNSNFRGGSTQEDSESYKRPHDQNSPRNYSHRDTWSRSDSDFRRSTNDRDYRTAYMKEPIPESKREQQAGSPRSSEPKKEQPAISNISSFVFDSSNSKASVPAEAKPKSSTGRFASILINLCLFAPYLVYSFILFILFLFTDTLKSTINSLLDYYVDVAHQQLGIPAAK